MNANSVAKILVIVVPFKNMNAFTIKRTPMYISSVGKLLYSASFQMHKRIHAGEKPYVCKQCRKGLFIPMPLKYTDELTLGRIPMAVSGMGRLHLF